MRRRVYRAESGSILMWDDKTDSFVWRRPRRRWWWPALTLVTLALLILLMWAALSQPARADSGLPFGVSCEQVQRYAADLNIPNTWRGRMQARAIALTFGHYLTNAELTAAARCLRDARARD